MYLFAKRHHTTLERYAWSKTLIALDFDGTLAPIVETPSAAGLSPRTRSLLAEVARRYPCVVISGRARADVQRRLQGIPVRHVIGNHGLEPSLSSKKCARLVRQWLPRLRQSLGSTSGLFIEDKTFSIAVHYRKSRHKKRDRAAIMDAARSLGQARLVGGKQVVNIVPEGAPHKGLALERIRKRLSCDNAIYVGDDDTDEDVFTLDHPERLLSIRVGASAKSAARYFVKSQKEIDRLLSELCSLRGEDATAKHQGENDALDGVFAIMQSIWGVNRGLELLSRRMHATLGVTGPQRLVVRIIGRFPGITARKLSLILHLDRSTMSSLIAGLARRDLVKRDVDPSDRRRVLLSLTARGRTLDVPASDTLEAVIKRVLEHQQPRTIEAGASLLKQLAEALRMSGEDRQLAEIV